MLNVCVVAELIVQTIMRRRWGPRIARAGQNPRRLGKAHILWATSETTRAPKLPTAIDLIRGVSMMASPGIGPRAASRAPHLQAQFIPTRPQRPNGGLCQYCQAIHVSPTPTIIAVHVVKPRLICLPSQQCCCRHDHLHV